MNRTWLHCTVLFLLSLVTKVWSADPPTMPLTNNKCGISLKVLGEPGTDYAFERFYHDPKIDDHGVIYVRSNIKLALEHNEQNVILTGRETKKVIGINGADGIADSGDEGIIRMKPDMDRSWRFNWANGNSDKSSCPEEQRVPRYVAPFTLADLTYYDGIKVLGAFGPSKGTDATASTDKDFYYRGCRDDFGDEWHTITVGDDDEKIPGQRAQKYDTWSSDGRVYLLVVNPKTPAIGFLTDPAAQYYTTPAKTYFVPHIFAQTTYLTKGVSFFFTNLTDPAQSVRWRIDQLHKDTWQTYAEPIRLDTLNLQPDAVYTLRYRIGDQGPEKIRQLHFEPSNPSDREPHPSPVLFKDDKTLAAIRKNIETLPTHKAIYENMVRRPNAEAACTIFFDGAGRHPEQEKITRENLLDNLLALDPVGHEILHNLANPCRDRVQYGYYYAGAVLNIATAYDLTIRQLRPGKSPHAITAIEDLKIRDYFGNFAMETMMMRHEYPLPTGPAMPFFHTARAGDGMWDTSRYLALQMVCMMMPTYDSPYYGTCGADGKTKATHPFTPFEKTALTWFEDSVLQVPEFGPMPKAGSPIWSDRGPYFSTMGWLYAVQANARANFDGTRYPHVELAFRLAAEGKLKAGKVMTGDSAFIEGLSDRMMNETFPDIARLTQDKFAANEAIVADNILAKKEGRPERPVWRGNTLSGSMYGLFSLCYCRPLVQPAP